MRMSILLVCILLCHGVLSSPVHYNTGQVAQFLSDVEYYLSRQERTLSRSLLGPGYVPCGDLLVRGVLGKCRSYKRLSNNKKVLAIHGLSALVAKRKKAGQQSFIQEVSSKQTNEIDDSLEYPIKSVLGLLNEDDKKNFKPDGYNSTKFVQRDNVTSNFHEAYPIQSQPDRITSIQLNINATNQALPDKVASNTDGTTDLIQVHGNKTDLPKPGATINYPILDNKNINIPRLPGENNKGISKENTTHQKDIDNHTINGKIKVDNTTSSRDENVISYSMATEHADNTNNFLKSVSTISVPGNIYKSTTDDTKEISNIEKQILENASIDRTPGDTNISKVSSENTTSNIPIPDNTATNIRLMEAIASDIPISDYTTSDIGLSDATTSNIPISDYTTIDIRLSEDTNSDTTISDFAPIGIRLSEEDTTNNIPISNYTPTGNILSEDKANDVPIPDCTTINVRLSEDTTSDIPIKEYSTINIRLSEDTTSDIQIQEYTTINMRLSEDITSDISTSDYTTTELPLPEDTTKNNVISEPISYNSMSEDTSVAINLSTINANTTELNPCSTSCKEVLEKKLQNITGEAQPDFILPEVSIIVTHNPELNELKTQQTPSIVQTISLLWKGLFDVQSNKTDRSDLDLILDLEDEKNAENKTGNKLFDEISTSTFIGKVEEGTDTTEYTVTDKDIYGLANHEVEDYEKADDIPTLKIDMIDTVLSREETSLDSNISDSQLMVPITTNL